MRLASLAVATSAVALLVGCSAGPAPMVSDDRIRAVQADIDALVAGGVTGAIATVTENGKTVVRTSGVADLGTGSPIATEPPQRVRVGSITKSFTSALVLQLVAEGKVRLDEPVDTYLPGLLRGQGIHGRVITVRQLLRHQSGLPEIADDPRVDEYLAAVENRTMTPAEAIAIVLAKPAVFAPGARFAYSNSNYLVAGMLIERVTGATYSDALNRRILRPLALDDTYLPGPAEREIRGPHPEGYADVDGVVTDVTRIEPSVPWAAGAMVSTGADLNRFYAALLSGQVVPEPELREMRTGVLMDGEVGLDMFYGLGLAYAHLSCGADYFGHKGSIPGFVNVSGASPDGRAVTYTFTEAPPLDLPALLGHALC